MRAQSELLKASLTEIPEQAKGQRKAITRSLRQTFIDLVSQLKVPLILEIGAHEGGFSKEIKRMRPEARVIAFEAHPLVHARRAPALEEAGIEYLPLCVADQEGEVTLNVPEKHGSEGLHMGSLLRHKRAPGWCEYAVQAVTLDGFLGDAAALSNAMWIDVEGALAQVFGGAKHTLANCQAIHVELEHKPRWHGQMIDEDVILYLANYDLKPVLRDIQKNLFYNAIFMRGGVLPCLAKQ